MNFPTKFALFISFTVLLLSSLLCWQVNAQNDSFTLEVEQNWETYGVGGTCIYGTHNIFVGDVDGDRAMEIVTGGFAYNLQNGSRIAGSYAPLRVWSWDGNNVTLKAEIDWNGTIYCLYAADVDMDGTVEILTAGSYRNETGSYTTLRVWHLTNSELTLQANFEGIAINSLFVNDVDKDGALEILSVGRLRTGNMNTSQLHLWNYQANTLSIDRNASLESANVAVANSVYASDLDKDGNQEVVIGGYADILANSKGQLSIWQWNGQEFALKANREWQLGAGTAKTIAGGTQGNTIVNNVKAADLEGDSYPEIVTGGFAYDGEKVNAQLKIWRWDGAILTEKVSQEWATDYMTEVKSLALDDVDRDGKTDIIESGITAAEGSFNNPDGVHDRGQLRVYGWNGTALTLKYGKDWTFDEGACAWNVAYGDLDKDGVVEIVTVGCTALKGLCDPDMRIWSLPTVSSRTNYPLYVLGAAILASCTLSLIYLLVKKKSNKPYIALSMA